MKNCIIFITYKTDEAVLKHFTQLKNDLCSLSDVDIWVAYNCTYDQCQIDHSNVFNYNKKLVENDGFTLHYYYWRNFGDFYGHNNDLVMIDFYYHHKEYDRYWFIDYDVLYTGNWSDIITYFNDKDYDFLCSNLLLGYSIDPCFKVHPVGINYDLKNQYHGFTSIMMMSNLSLEYLLELYKKDNYGFIELFFVNALYHNTYNGHKFNIGTFNEHGFVDGVSQGTNSTMNVKNWTPNEIKNFKPNKLYHAVKKY